MTRIIVKNLPHYLTAEELKSHFARQGEVTDAKIMLTPNGKSRQFGFVGYKSNEDAEKAVAFFNRTFIDTFRLSVQIAKPIGDAEIERPWSRYSKQKAESFVQEKQDDLRKKKYEDLNEKMKKHLKAIGISDDPKLREYLEVMKKKKIWENDDVIEVPQIKTKADDDEDLYEDMPNKQETTDVKSDNEESEKKNEEQENLDILADTGRIFVRNLGFSTTEQDLKVLFERFGPTSEIHIPIDVETKTPKGIAFVSFMIPEHAIKAFSELDGQIFQGRLLHIIPSRERRKVEVPADSTFKDSRRKQLKERSTDEKTWNSLFMNADAVADCMAKRLNVAKSDILDPHADNMAVRMALAETHVIEETVKALEEEGVFIDAFKQNMKKERSETVILVKNIPFNAARNELFDLFRRHGDILRLVLPSTKTLALVEYSSSNEAKVAFKSLSYKNFLGKPLLLEMAPVGVFTKAASAPVSKIKNDLEIEEELPTATLFVKNLNFKTTNDDLSAMFQPLDGFRSATVSTKKDLKNTGKVKSMGFGFIEFRGVEAAENALKTMQGTLLDGHALELKFSDRSALGSGTNSAQSGKEVKAKGTKLLVRNVAFEATKKDIHDLFATFGQLKTVKLPRKFDNKTHRGFAFVDFATKQEAKNAFERLANTHLYGRHLVLEWAEDEESVDGLREKTKRIYDSLNQESEFSARKKISLDEDKEEEDGDDDL